jgi:hypothetical protein
LLINQFVFEIAEEEQSQQNMSVLETECDILFRCCSGNLEVSTVEFCIEALSKWMTHSLCRQFLPVR